MKALIWDFDGTLAYRAGGGWAAALLEVIRQEGDAPGVTADQIRPFLQSGFPWHTPGRPHPEIRSADQWWEALAPVLERALCGAGSDNEFAARAQRMARRVRHVYPDPRRWRLYDGALPTLDQLSAQGWTHAILSNHVPELPHIVRSLALEPYIAEIWNSAETGYEKPHPCAFQVVLEAFAGAAAIWMIGDSLRIDVAGAEAVGLPGILVRSTHPRARHCCRSLSEVPMIVGGEHPLTR